MKKYVIFGGFDYAVKWEMNQDAIYTGIDYFVETDSKLIGKEYLGKKIYGIEKLREDKDNIFVLIGSVVYHTELELQLIDMGYQEGKDYTWALGWPGDEKCKPLWYTVEWNSADNIAGQRAAENGMFSKSKYRVVARLIPEEIRTVVDLGAATGMLEEYLKEGIDYVPVDYIKYSDKQIVCDLNQYEFPEICEKADKTCIVMCGIIQAVADWKWLLRTAAEQADVIICSHFDVVRPSRDFRREHQTWKNAVFNHQVILEMQKLGFRMVEAYDHQLRVVIMKFERIKNDISV